jgi:hypothetical protein
VETGHSSKVIVSDIAPERLAAAHRAEGLIGLFALRFVEPMEPTPFNDLSDLLGERDLDSLPFRDPTVYYGTGCSRSGQTSAQPQAAVPSVDYNVSIKFASNPSKCARAFPQSTKEYRRR